MQQLSPMDAAFLYLENESTHAHGTLVWIYDASDCTSGAINRKALLDHMASRLNVSPIFTRKIHRLPLDFDYPYWVDDEGFELLYHVRERVMPENGNWEDFCNLVAEVHSQPLNHDHPLWEMTLVPELQNIPGLPKRCFAILGKFHHVAIDGATGMEIITRIHDCPDNPEPSLSHPAPRSARKPGLREGLFRAAVRNVAALDKSLELMGVKPRPASEEAEDAPPVVETVIEETYEDPAGIPQTIFNKSVGNESAWDSRSFDLTEIKKMRLAVPGATVNDVLLTVCGGGLRSYLASINELPESSMKAGCPVNIRTAEEASRGGNKISAIIISMHTNIEDPLKRLAAITQSSAAAKHRASQRGSRKVLDLVSIVPAQAQALLGHAVGAATKQINRAFQFNCSVSNLPGPQQELHMLGGRLHTISAAMPVMNGFGLFVGLTTCAGKLSISMSSSAKILPTPSQLGDAMDESYQALRLASIKGAKAKRPRKQN
ncbi:MAG: wax ester/triacylglycerol synthase family O-acyltransferase [Halieaceae bacterium]